MDTDFGQVFDEDNTQEPEIPVDQIVEEAPVVEPVVEAEPAPEPEVKVQPEPVEQPKDDTKQVPLGTMLDMRDKWKAAELRVAELEAAQVQRQPIPDPLDDPEGYHAYFEQRARDVEINTRINTSRMIAIQQYGQEEVDSAAKWFLDKVKEDPTYEQRLITQPHPADWVVRQHKREALLGQIGDDPDEYVRRRAAELGLTAPTTELPVVVPQQASTPVRVPRSLASQGSADSDIRHTPTGPLAGADAVFN